ncbi:MAG TPA: hypothetical protein VK435_05495 [Thermodesulfovibrionales bacterium]|nr:hypothetical protein [Thermodesulfovibrionales bacterium]
MIKYIESKQKELKTKEEFLSQEEKKLDALKKDVELKTDKYTKLLAEIDAKLKTLEKVKSERMTYIVKVYEGMPSEEAASKLSALDEQTATEIIRSMKPKKAGAVLSNMEDRKVASITRGMRRLEKSFPAD